MRRLPAAVALALALTASTGLPSPVAAEPAASSTVPAATSTTSPAGPVASTTTASTAGTASTTTSVTTEPTTTTTTTLPIDDGPAARAHAAPANATVTITTDNGDCFSGCFSPMTTTIAAGGIVTFRNPTDLDHTVQRCTSALCNGNGNGGGTGVDADFSQGTFALPPDVSFELTFAQPGTYVYYCSLHGYAQMHGTITVTAAEPATTLAPATLPPTVAPSVVEDPNGLASTGGAPVPLLGLAGAFLVVGLAATGLAARRHTEHDR